MAEVALLRMDKKLLKKQLMKAVRDEDFWDVRGKEGAQYACTTCCCKARAQYL